MICAVVFSVPRWWSLAGGGLVFLAGLVLSGVGGGPAREVVGRGVSSKGVVGREVVTFAEDVAPIVARKCLPCHVDSGPGPFGLLAGEDFLKHWPLVRFQGMSRSMPPTWGESDFGELSEAPPLTDAEILLLQRWDQGGRVMGDSSAVAFAEPGTGWRGGEPDWVVQFGEGARTEAEGVVYWEAFASESLASESLASGAAEARFWVGGLDVRVDSPKSVRRVVVYAVRGERSWSGRVEGGELSLEEGRLVGSWAPGWRRFSLPARSGIRLEAGERLVALAQVQPRGKSEGAGFEVGLYGVSGLEGGQGGGLVEEAVWWRDEARDFVIRAGEEKVLTLERRVARDVDLVAVFPEARWYCSGITVEAVLPGGEVRNVFSTSRWEMAWAGNYQFARPVRLAAGTVLRARFVYPNDPRCAMNEGREPEDVFWGRGRDEELCRMGYLVVGGVGSGP